MTNLSTEIQRYESMLFDNHTTPRSDFAATDLTPDPPTIYKEKPKCYRIRPLPLKDLHSMSNWKVKDFHTYRHVQNSTNRASVKDVIKTWEDLIEDQLDLPIHSRFEVDIVPNVPFDMFWKPDPIIRRNPHNIQTRFEAPVDDELEKIRETRPRLVMTPGISLDDIKDNNIRDMLILDTYTSTVMHANREMASRLKKTTPTKAPHPGRPAEALPVYVPSLRPQRVPPEWRMESVSWESRQLRSYVRPTQEFWLGRK